MRQSPDDAVREVVFPAVTGGEQTLRELVHEFKTKGPVYRRTVQTTLRASYTGHYRRGLIALLEILEFCSNNSAHRPVTEALTLISRYAKAGNLTYYPIGERVPAHRGATGDWSDLIYKTDTRGRQRVTRMVYEVATFQALPERGQCRRRQRHTGGRGAGRTADAGHLRLRHQHRYPGGGRRRRARTHRGPCGAKAQPRSPRTPPTSLLRPEHLHRVALPLRRPAFSSTGTSNAGRWSCTPRPCARPRPRSMRWSRARSGTAPR